MNNPLHVAIFFWRWALSYKCWHVLFVNLSSLYSLSLRKIQKKILQTFWIYSCCYQGKRKKAPLICYKLNRYLTTKEPPQKKKEIVDCFTIQQLFFNRFTSFRQRNWWWNTNLSHSYGHCCSCIHGCSCIYGVLEKAAKCSKEGYLQKCHLRNEMMQMPNENSNIPLEHIPGNPK